MRCLSLVAALAALPPDMVRVPAGATVVGSDGDEEDERPAHRVALAEFAIDRDEVTVAAYRKCVDARACAGPRGRVGADDEPVTFVTWRDAEIVYSLVSDLDEAALYDLVRTVGR